MKMKKYIFKKLIITIAIIIIICILFIFPNFKSLKLNSYEEIEVEIRNALIDFDKSYILKGERKNKLLDILNGTKLGPYLFESSILRNSTISIRLFGKGVQNSRFPVYIYYSFDESNKLYRSKAMLNNKLYSINKEVISQLRDFFDIPDEM